MASRGSYDTRQSVLTRLIAAQRAWAEKFPGSPTAGILAEAIGEIREYQRILRDESTSEEAINQEFRKLLETPIPAHATRTGKKNRLFPVQKKPRRTNGLGFF